MTIVNFFFSDLSHMHFPSTFLNWSLFFKRLQSVRVGAAPTGHWFDSQHRAAPCSRALQQPSVLNPLLLADSCPTRLCQCLWYSKTNQWYVHISSFLHLLPIQVTVEHSIEVFVLHSSFSLGTYFLHDCVYMSTPIYKVIPSHRSLPLHLWPQSSSPLNSTYLRFITYFPIFGLVFKLTQNILFMILGIQTRLFLEENKCRFPYTWFTILV